MRFRRLEALHKRIDPLERALWRSPSSPCTPAELAFLCAHQENWPDPTKAPSFLKENYHWISIRFRKYHPRGQSPRQLGITNTDKAAQQSPPPSNKIEKPATGVASAWPPLHSAKVSTGGVPPASPQTSPPPLNSAKDAEARMSSAERPTPPSPHDAEKPADGGPPALKPTRRPDPYADRPFPPGPGRSVKPCQYFSEGADIAAVGSRLPTRDAPTKENP